MDQPRNSGLTCLNNNSTFKVFEDISNEIGSSIDNNNIQNSVDKMPSTLLKVCFFNARSITNKLILLKNFLNDDTTDFDIIFITA